MCDRYSAWLKDAAIQNGPILPWSPVPSHCCKRDLGTGLAPTGYKLMRRVSQKQKGSALDLLNKRNRNFNGKRGIKKNVANNLQQSWRFDGEPPKAVLRDFGTIDWILGG